MIRGLIGILPFLIQIVQKIRILPLHFRQKGIYLIAELLSGRRFLGAPVAVEFSNRLLHPDKVRIEPLQFRQARIFPHKSVRLALLDHDAFIGKAVDIDPFCVRKHAAYHDIIGRTVRNYKTSVFEVLRMFPSGAFRHRVRPGSADQLGHENRRQYDDNQYDLGTEELPVLFSLGGFDIFLFLIHHRICKPFE